MSISQQVILVVTLMITSKGIAGVPGVSFIVLLATLGSVGIPVEGLAFIAGVDRIMDMARTALNVVGNALAVLVISKWENNTTMKKLLLMKHLLSNREVLVENPRTSRVFIVISIHFDIAQGFGHTYLLTKHCHRSDCLRLFNMMLYYF